MADLLNEADAALLLLMSPTLLREFTVKCPKYGEERLLQFTEKSGVYFYDRDELLDYNKYLSSKWPKTKKDKRPSTPDSIKNEIFTESQYRCAFCPETNRLEAAHIEGWAKTQSNHPHNLISACPNHHTQYDYGFKLIESLSEQRVRWVKKDLSGVMRLRLYSLSEPAKEGIRLAKTLSDMSDTIEKLGPDMSQGLEEVARTIIAEAPTHDASKPVPDDLKAADTEAQKTIAAAKQITKKIDRESTIRAVKSFKKMEAKFKDIFDSLDIEPCPHCGGRGTIGWSGRTCDYCNGNRRVTQKQLEEYNPDLIDFVECPHCRGKGLIGINGEICEVCDGDRGVTAEKAKKFDPDKLKTVPCPRCSGRGFTGLDLYPCGYCGGDKWISKEMADDYDPNKIDEVECPHCSGKGLAFDNEFCKLCDGHCVVDRKTEKEYVRRYR